MTSPHPNIEALENSSATLTCNFKESCVQVGWKRNETGVLIWLFTPWRDRAQEEYSHLYERSRIDVSNNLTHSINIISVSLADDETTYKCECILQQNYHTVSAYITVQY